MSRGDLKEIDIVKELSILNKRGYIRTLRDGDTGIGYTLETLLKIKENNSGEADFLYNEIPVELKAQRFDATSRITLITKTPHWIPMKADEIIRKFGYKDVLGRQALKITLNARGDVVHGFRLELDKKENKLNIIHGKEGVVSYYKIDELVKNIKKKLYENLLLVIANRKIEKIVNVKDNKKTEKKVEYFNYNKAILLQKISEDKFEEMLLNGLVVWEFRMHLKENGKVRDHGPGFRISRLHISKLFEKQKVIFDGSKQTKLSSGQK